MAVSAKDPKLLEQKDLISQLNTTIAAQTELIQSLKKDHEADVDLKAPAIKVPEHTCKKKRTLEELFKGVPFCDEIISLPENKRVCDECGVALEPIGKEFVLHALQQMQLKKI